MKYLIGAIIMLAGSVANALDFSSLNWEKDLDRDNLTIYVADVPGSDLKAFKAVSTYNATLDQMVSVITDMGNFANWMHGAAEASSLKIEGNVQWCYFQNDVPWPYKNRDTVIIQTLTKKNDDEIWINLTTDRDMIKQRRGVVRLNHLVGDWIIKKLSDTQVELTYQVHLDPTGNVPAWVVNLMLTETPKNTMVNLHKQNFAKYTSKPLMLAGL